MASWKRSPLSVLSILPVSKGDNSTLHQHRVTVADYHFSAEFKKAQVENYGHQVKSTVCRKLVCRVTQSRIMNDASEFLHDVTLGQGARVGCSAELISTELHHLATAFLRRELAEGSQA